MFQVTNPAKRDHEAVGEEARERLAKVLAMEYKLYRYVRERLDQQYKACKERGYGS